MVAYGLKTSGGKDEVSWKSENAQNEINYENLEKMSGPVEGGDEDVKALQRGWNFCAEMRNENV